MSTGLFSGIEQAKPSKGGIYFEPGNYLVEIVECKGGKTFMKRPFFVVETKILESDNANRRPKTNCSWMAMLDQPSGLPNVKAFCAVAHGCSDDDVDEAGVEHIISAAQPFKGKKMRVQAISIKTRENKDFTKIVWSLAEDLKS